MLDSFKLHTCTAGAVHGRDVSEGFFCSLWFSLGVCEVGPGQDHRVSTHRRLVADTLVYCVASKRMSKFSCGMIDVD